VKILICATGTKHINEAIRFIDNHQSLIDDIIVYSNEPKLFKGVECYENKETGYKSKIFAIKNIKAEKFLYIDCDTYIYSLDNIDYFTKKYDIIASYEIMGITDAYFSEKIQEQKIEQIEYQTGVVFFRKNQTSENLIDEWYRTHDYLEQKYQTQIPDQLSFRLAINKTNFPIGIFPNNWNFRAYYPQTISGKVKIVHSRKPIPNNLNRNFLESETIRLYVSGKLYLPIMQSFFMKITRFFDRINSKNIYK